jgi:O2-independent ubiquinone biosynthesis protein UbiV
MSALTLGPLLFNWRPEQRRDFYARIADEAPVDCVYLGEVVCSKREPFFVDDLPAIAERLVAAGKQVVYSTLALVTTDREMEEIRTLCGGKAIIEANDVASISLIAGAPFVSGPFINTFNEATIDFLVARGATRIGLPVELSAAAIATLARHNPVETEALVFGRQGLSLSMRCYHARAYGLHKDSCQFVCEQDPDGLAADQLDGKPLLVVNGTQTLSHGYAAAFEDLAPLQEAGVSHFRLSPQVTDMVKVASLFRAALDGRIAPAEAQAELAAQIAPTPLIDGYMRGKAGMSFSGGAALL